MICIDKNCYIAVISVAKAKNFILFALTYVLVSFELLYGDFCMNSSGVDSDEAIKRGDVARWWSVKRFIASVFKKR